MPSSSANNKRPDQSEDFSQYSSENVTPINPQPQPAEDVQIKPLDDNQPSSPHNHNNSQLVPKVKKKLRFPKVIFNVTDTQYPVIKAVGKKVFKWKLTYELDDDWDICWTDNAVQTETLGKMKPYQKINHFPGMYCLARKNYLGKALMKMKKIFNKAYNFFPKTWMLPSDLSDFRSQFQQIGKEKKKIKTYIVKPESGCQGKGIYLVRNLDEIPQGEHCVVQAYKNKPHLIEGLKYDLRIYVLVAGCDPLRIYVYKEGLARFATEEYVPANNKNLTDICMHLTNYAINKNSDKFVFNNDENNFDTGHKRSYSYVLRYLASQGIDTKKLQDKIHAIFIKTLCSAQPILAHNYRSCQPENHPNNMCFEVLGMDILLDANLKPYLLEVNHTPSFTTDTPLDKNIKKGLIRDAMLLLNISGKNKVRIRNQMKMDFQKRVVEGKKEKVTPEQKIELIKQAQQARDQYEDLNCGGYTKIFPCNESDGMLDYIEYQAGALKIYQDSTGANIRRNVKKTDVGLIDKPQIINKNEELNKIYAKKIKVPKKYENVKSKVQCYNMFYKKDQENDQEEVRSAGQDREEHNMIDKEQQEQQQLLPEDYNYEQNGHQYTSINQQIATGHVRSAQQSNRESQLTNRENQFRIVTKQFPNDSPQMNQNFNQKLLSDQELQSLVNNNKNATILQPGLNIQNLLMMPESQKLMTCKNVNRHEGQGINVNQSDKSKYMEMASMVSQKQLYMKQYQENQQNQQGNNRSYSKQNSNQTNQQKQQQQQLQQQQLQLQQQQQQAANKANKNYANILQLNNNGNFLQPKVFDFNGNPSLENQKKLDKVNAINNPTHISNILNVQKYSLNSKNTNY